MILFDTSAWIDYLRGVDTAATQDVRRRLTESADEVVTCEPVAMELLAGAPNDSVLRKLEHLVNALPSLAIDSTTDFRAAADIYRSARRAGLTVRSLNDCLIATIALRHGATLVHKDAEFDVIAGVIDIDAVSLRT
ncbi:MAG: PIN domain-containing protein [Propionibacteriales bacterium]|nr:PIN domain-containing protein [Propionibacteriales bacterium]